MAFLEGVFYIQADSAAADDASDRKQGALAQALAELEGLRALMAESLAKARAWPASSTFKTL